LHAPLGHASRPRTIGYLHRYNGDTAPQLEQRHSYNDWPHYLFGVAWLMQFGLGAMVGAVFSFCVPRSGSVEENRCGQRPLPKCAHHPIIYRCN
jgi:hypothetical protein